MFSISRVLLQVEMFILAASTHKMPAKEGYKSHSPHISIEDGAIHDVEDFATAFIRMNNGMIIQLETSWNHHIPEDVFQFESVRNKGGQKHTPARHFEDGRKRRLIDKLSIPIRKSAQL